MSDNVPTPKEFEDTVRRVARALWPSAARGGAEMVNNREVDGVFRTDEVIHMVEATMNEKVDKARQDGPKLRDHLKRNRSGRGLFAKAWFVTYKDPTAHQREVLHKEFDPNIEVISFERFRAKLVDAREYLELRDKVDWGSASNPQSQSKTKLLPYVPLTIEPVLDEASRDGRRTRVNSRPALPGTLNVEQVVALVEKGERVALLGDYGAGKSMTMRELHAHLGRRYLSGASLRFPITLSLRKHYGQDDPDEAIHRHAKYIGYDHPNKLVRAWRAGYVHVLLDGFDELAAPGWSGSLDHLRENRREATRLIAEFATNTSEEAGVVVAGRRFYFDSLQEMSGSLFDQRDHVRLALNSFTDAQTRLFLEYFKKWDYALPVWLPTRPLLLGHLAAEELLDDIARQAPSSRAEGWDWLLDRVSDREAFIKQGIDGSAVRAVIENLASIARGTLNGVGPVTPFDIANAFTEVRHKQPSDKDLTLLQRLPGLGGEEEDLENGTRRFVDVDLASAAQAAHVSQFIRNPFADNAHRRAHEWTSSMEPLGVEVAAHQTAEVEDGQLKSALSAALRADCDELAADIVRVASINGIDISRSPSGPLTISEAIIPSFDIGEDGPDLSGVSFSHCIFLELTVSGDLATDRIPFFSECSFESVLGRLGPSDLPGSRFSDCEFNDFPDSGDSNAAILDSSSLRPGTRVVMILLRKLYLQRGSGRRDSALPRGMKTADARLVQPALRLLERENLVFRSRVGKSLIWLPDRSSGPRVRAFLLSPRAGDDPLVEASAAITG
ncbi:hypothetical protein GCM10020358_66010 [Amorphoplanes nipponensis]|uniref:NACHT domain-containing protein n=1 Tax=Actinoplanes nipponensis TaxID=135950 RepID=A0A919JRM4_9ACTN|nr:NACHT domain-containing protein [Actinoplanes nipponensis]GIE51714.1 hypothetical protein Ani05nite_52480 [Actinoplanes nipponensis]